MEKQIIEILERFFPSNNPCARKRKFMLSNQKAAARSIIEFMNPPACNQMANEPESIFIQSGIDDINNRRIQGDE